MVFKSEHLAAKQKHEFNYVLSEYDQLLLAAVEELGGFCNAHCHLDRCSTLDKKYLKIVGIDPIEGASLPLRLKQNLTGELHRGPAYDKDNLKDRIKKSLLNQREMLTTSITTFVDATPDLPESGFLVVNILNELKEEFQDTLSLKIAAHPIFGFHKKNDEQRWRTYKEVAEYVDVLGALPERDEPITNKRIGYKEHLKRILLLGQELYKCVHVHVDQANDPKETGTETLIQAVEWIGAPKIDAYTNIKEPTVWAIHSISPSCYSEKRFNRMIDGLLRNNIGVIVCPSAALSMRQLRPIKTPTHNSIARVLELLGAGVRVKIGTDNIADVFVPSSDGCMLNETKLLSNAIRFYIINVLAKLAAGRTLNQMDGEMIRRSLAADEEIFNKIKVG